MPTYDYRCADGTVFEAYSPFDSRRTAVHPESGCLGTQVWITPPSVDVPLHHQSAPNASPKTIEFSRRSRDPKDTIQVLESGMDRDNTNSKKDRIRKSEKWIEPAVAETVRETII